MGDDDHDNESFESGSIHSSESFESGDQEIGLELLPPRSSPPPEIHEDNPMEDEYGRLLTQEEQDNLANTQHIKPVIERFPFLRAGEVLSHRTKHGYEDYRSDTTVDTTDNLYAPFASKVDWEVARWAKLRGPGSTAVTELMEIDGVSAVLITYPLLHLKSVCDSYKNG
jgi:hypothetical protein